MPARFKKPLTVHTPPRVRRHGGGNGLHVVLTASTILAACTAFATSLDPAGPAVAIPAAKTDERMTLDDARRVAQEAYVWGWPLAYVHHCRVSLARVPFAGRSGGMPVAPINRLAMLADRASPRMTGVACPNQDVLYGFGMFDLATAPVVLQVPDFGSRFWLYQLGDQRTDAFANVGCMYGTRPGCYLVVGPGWTGQAPAGIAGVFRSPTRYAYCIPRVFFTADPADREAALPAVNRIAAYPLDEFMGVMQSQDWSKARWLPDFRGRSRRAVAVSPATFFDVLPEVLDDVPPLPGEEPLYARYRRLLHAMSLDPTLRSGAVESVAEADRDVVAPLFQFRNVGRPVAGHWTTLVNGGEFGTDYLTRTAVAKSNVFVNRHRETKYYFQDLDARGRRLHGRQEYRITFLPGALPPAQGFWSLTVYDDQHRLPQNDHGRHAIGSRDTAMEYGSDGSLTIVVTPAVAADAGEHRDGDPEAGSSTSANRLSAPDGEFSLYLRIYWPDEAALDGSWLPPVVDRVASSLQQAGN